jgi:aminopeptidase N
MQVGLGNLFMKNLGLLFGLFLSCLSGLTPLKAQPLSAHPAQDSVAIQHTHLALRPDFATQTLHGVATYQLQVASGATRFVPLLHNSLSVDSVKRFGAVVNPVRLLDTVFIPLVSGLSSQEVTIFYHGQPHVEAANFGGFHFAGGVAFNLGVAFNELPHPFGRTMFPAYDNFHARSTYSLALESDSDYVALGGGNLDSVQLLGQGRKRWHYSFAESMPSYLIGVSWGKFAVRRGFLQGMNGPIPYHIATQKADSNLYVTAFKHLQTILTVEEQAWGPYPFPNIGFSLVGNIGGAMEHAGNIAMPTGQTNDSVAFTRLIAHELSHAWWGNHTTCARAEEMWLNEGWASYNELLIVEHLYGAIEYRNEVRKQHRDVLLNARKSDKGAYPLNKVPQTYTYGMHSYTKGADIVAILRAQMGPSFFQAAKNHQLVHPNDTANSYQLEAAFAQIRPEIARPYFRNYVYSHGYPSVVRESSKWVGQTLQFKKTTFTQNHQYRSGFSYFDTLPVILRTYPEQVGGNTVGCRDSLYMTGLADSSLLCRTGFGHLIFDSEEEFGFAKSDELIDNPPVGIRTLQNGGITLRVLNEDSANVFWIEQHFVGPTNTGIIGNQWYMLNPSRFWSVLSPKPSVSSFPELKGTFRFESGAFSIDDSLTYLNLNDLRLLHRPSESSPWAICAGTVYANSGSFNRSATLELQVGDYVWGAPFGGLGYSEPNDKELETNHKAYPNPSSGLVILEGLEANSADCDWFAIDVLGKQWPIKLTIRADSEGVSYEQKISAQTDLSGMPSGVYLLTSSKAQASGASFGSIRVVLLPNGR